MDCTATPGETTSPADERDPGALLAAGRFEAARAAARDGRRRGAGTRPPAVLALLECDALSAVGRDAEALGVATRALARTPPDGDHAARLRLARALALWHTGRVAAARADARRALERAEDARTRGRALEALGLFAWKDDETARGRDLLQQAVELHEAGAAPAGVVRAGGLLAELERDAWRFHDALARHERRVALAGRMQRAHLLAAARVDQASLLAHVGCWGEAAQALAAGVAGGAEPAAVALVQATLAQARGDLGAAQRALRAAREGAACASRPRALADWHLRASDLALALADAAGADGHAAEAMRLFALLGEPAGRCRARVRRAHALLALGRHAEALAEARRALGEAGAGRPELLAHAGLALARALGRTRPSEARELYARVAERCGEHAGFLAVARFGHALAGGAAEAALAERVAAVESWGDRRVLSYCLAERRHARGREVPPPSAAPSSVRTGEEPGAVDPVARALVDAVHAFAGEGSWPDRWAESVRALGTVVPWFRAAYVAEPGFEVRRDGEEVRPLAADDLARVLSTRVGGGARVVDLSRSELRLHPTRGLHDLRAAVVAPAGAGAVAYFDFRGADALPSDRQVAAAGELARLLERFPPDVPPRVDAEVASPAGLVGESDLMKALFQAVDRVARFDLTVHVCGETGTGKERVAQALHQRSGRAARPFVAVNASSLSDELFESEMFGHLRGAFTGAVADREGHVADAEGGTLFLDEVTDLSPRGQAKLLRLLEQKEYRRVGEGRLRQADVRFVTASNVPLERRVAEGRFRVDLMYRLNRLVLPVPALRERSDDVGRLARHFLRRAAVRAGVAVPALSAEAERALRAYAWPGNVRELENEMARLVVMGAGGAVRRAHLAPTLLDPPARGAVSLREALLDFEREHIARALRLHGGNRARTACTLGLSRQALVAKIARLGIESVAPR